MIRYLHYHNKAPINKGVRNICRHFRNSLSHFIERLRMSVLEKIVGISEIHCFTQRAPTNEGTRKICRHLKKFVILKFELKTNFQTLELIQHISLFWWHITSTSKNQDFNIDFLNAKNPLKYYFIDFLEGMNPSKLIIEYWIIERHYEIVINF